MRNLGAAIAGGGGKRRENDFYATPPEAVIALLRSRALEGWPRIWEPACGDGAMACLLPGDTLATDLVYRGYGLGDVDFLTLKRALAPAIVTNPPFNLAEKFLRHAWALGVAHVALLLKATFFHAASRLPLFSERPPAEVLPLTWRLDFTGGGAPTMDCSWFVWRPEECEARVRLLRRPA